MDDDQHLQELEVQQALNNQVLQLSASMAMAEQARLHVGHAWDAIETGSLRSRLLSGFDVHLNHYNETVRQHRQENLDRLLQRLTPDLRSDKVEIQTQLVKGAPREVIPSLANALEADLVVMGSDEIDDELFEMLETEQ